MMNRLPIVAAVLGFCIACGDSGGTSTGTGGAAGTSNPTGPSSGGAGGATGGSTGGGAGTTGSGGTGGATGSGGAGAGGSATGGTAGTGGSSGGTGGMGATGGSGGITDAGTAADARSSDVSDVRSSDARGNDVSDAGAGSDASTRDVSITDAMVGDGGAAPYKGVANSPCNEMAMLGATWFYNWTLSRGNCTAPEFVPMLWGHTGTEQTPAGITNAMNTLVANGYKTVLGFNEPDNTGQANMTVATAISLWPSFNNPALRIGSPATSANAAGQTWFKDFMAQVNADTTGTLRVDFIAAHWYGWNAGSCEANAATLESYLKTIEAIPGNRPIWLTEWGCMNQSNPDDATVVAFFKGAIAMFAKHPRLERYAWYPWNPHNELFVDGGLSPMGTAFAQAPQYK